jgi:hypothetical protein
MAVAFANGKRALGICDRCGFRFLLNTLKSPSIRGIKQNTRLCDTCFDPDHPQNFQGMKPVYDPQALRNARPDVPEAPVPAYNPPTIG